MGPTLEFYALVSRELQRLDLGLFRGDPCPIPGATRRESDRTLCPPPPNQLFIVTVIFKFAEGVSDAPEYVHSPVGLFPVSLGPSTRFSVVEEICSKFRFLGKLMAKAIMDSRMVSIVASLQKSQT